MDVSTTPDHSRIKLITISCGLVWLIYFFVQSVLLWWFDFTPPLFLYDGLISATILSLASYVLITNLSYYQPTRRRYAYILVWGIILSAASLTLIRYLLNYLFDNRAYLDFVDSSLPLRFCFNALILAWVAMVHILWNILQEHRENEQRKLDAERLAKEAELYNLRQQLQPHFLFNSLNSIIALIGRKPDQARDMTFQLSDFLRGTLRKDDQQLIPLEDELEHLKLYLEIEKVRFGHRLETEIYVADNCSTCMLPAMILQPLLENAIKYGLYDTTDQVTIRLTAELSEGSLLISIENPYDPQSSQPRKGTGFGLRGVKRRLYLLFGRTDLLQTKATAHIFTSVIKIPQYDQNAADR